MSRTPSEIDELLHSAVVPIRVYLTEAEAASGPASRVGTGYLVHPYYVATCYHTVRGATESPILPFVPDLDVPFKIEIAAGTIPVGATLVESHGLDQTKLTELFDSIKLPSTPEREALVKAYSNQTKIVRANSLRDCALLRLSAPLSGRRCLPFGTGCTIGEPVWIRGFPQPGNWGEDSLEMLQPLQFPGNIVSTCAPDFQGRVCFAIYADALAAHAYPQGLSGAPVVTMDGLCVGHIKNYPAAAGHNGQPVRGPLVHAGQLYVAPSIYLHQLMPNVLLAHQRNNDAFLPGRYIAGKKGRSKLRLAILHAEQSTSLAVASHLAEVTRAYVRSREPILEPIPLDEAARADADVYLFLFDQAALANPSFKGKLRSTIGSLRKRHDIIAFAYLSDVEMRQESELIREGLFESALDVTDEAGPFPSQPADTAFIAQQQYWLRMLSRLYRYLDSY